MPIYASEEEKNENTNKRKADTKGKRSMWSKVCLPRLLIVTAFSLSVATALHLSICVENIRLLCLQGISSAWARIWAGLRYGVELWGEGGRGGGHARQAKQQVSEGGLWQCGPFTCRWGKTTVTRAESPDQLTSAAYIVLL